MIQEIGNKKMDNQFKADVCSGEDDFVFIFVKAQHGPDEIYLGGSEEDKIRIPKRKDLDVKEDDLVYLFSIDEDKYYMAKPGIEIEVPEGFAPKSNRVLRKTEPKHHSFAAMTACHLNTWYNNNQYCGKCGTKTKYGINERHMKCPECGNVIYPRINPAVTVALIHDDKLLVTKYRGRAQTNMYALIAGFVEIGESTEECVAREVMEEVGLKVKNIKYYGSQPWGFAGNLQIGFWAEVDGPAEITMDENELSTAFFISREELEPNDNRPALTQEMIEEFRIGNTFSTL